MVSSRTSVDQSMPIDPMKFKQQIFSIRWFFRCISFVCIPFLTCSQERLEDLIVLNKIIQKTPSFRQQIRGQKKREYHELVNTLKSRIDENNTTFKHFEILSELAGQLRDNHFVLRYIPDSSFRWERQADINYVRQFLKQAHMREHPGVSINIDSLETVLKDKPRDEVEGIYYYYQSLEIGVYRKDSATCYGIILKSGLPIWNKGDMCFVLRERSQNQFHAIQYLISQKTLQLNMNEKFRDGALLEYDIKKRRAYHSYPFIPDSSKKFITRIIQPDVRYVRLGNFMVNAANRRESNSFIKLLEDSVKEQHIIMDLRNNNGGGFTISKKFLKFFISYSRKNKIHVLVNRKTISNAEQFLIRLKDHKHVTVFGETTKGMITYGSNYGKLVPLKSKGLFVYPTDMSGKKKDLQYETTGINPDIFLKEDSDWIEQIIKQL